MGLLPSLLDDAAVLVIDTSIVINLNATGCAEEILRAIPSRVLTLDVVAGELENGRSKGRHDAAKLAHLIKEDLIGIAKLGDPGLLHFEDLVIGAAADTLDDGESATIAHALETSAWAIVDERKALRICARRFPTLRLASTVDLLAHGAVQKALGSTSLADAVHGALRDARMQVHPHQMDWVVASIGDARAAECRCLPDAVRRQARSRL